MSSAFYSINFKTNIKIVSQISSMIINVWFLTYMANNGISTIVIDRQFKNRNLFILINQKNFKLKNNFILNF
jgi:hypothetical protein